MNCTCHCKAALLKYSTVFVQSPASGVQGKWFHLPDDHFRQPSPASRRRQRSTSIMTPEESQFLLAEFNQSWSFVSAIDERRGKFLQSITAVVIAAIGAVGFLISSEKGPLLLNRTIEAIALIVVTLIGCISVVAMLLAERDANVRYRKKANLVRQRFLGPSASPEIQDYLANHKGLGILLPGDAQEPKGVGSTLSAMLFFIALQLLGLVCALVYVIARYKGHVAA
jgi:hypothetical protein